jgi:hypothetical protein
VVAIVLYTSLTVCKINLILNCLQAIGCIRSVLSWLYGLDEDQHVYEYNKVTGDFFHVYFANKTGVSCVLDIDNTGVSDVGQILERAFEGFFLQINVVVYYFPTIAKNLVQMYPKIND